MTPVICVILLSQMVSVLPRSLNCLVIQHIIDDASTIEHYLAIDPETIEKCLPIALRDMLNEYAALANLPPVHTFSTSDLLKYLRIMWYFRNNINGMLNVAIKMNALYLIPYILMTYGREWTLDNSTLAAMGIDPELTAMKLLFIPPEVNGLHLWRPVTVDPVYLTELMAMNGRIKNAKAMSKILLSSVPLHVLDDSAVYILAQLFNWETRI